MAVRGEYDDSIRRAMAELTGSHAKDTALVHSLATVAASAVELVDGVDFADVMVINGGRVRSVTTVPLLAELDTAQVVLQEGPCLAAAVSGAMIRCTDLRDDARWPRYAAEAVSAGVHSMLSFQLDTAQHGVGALNMFGLDPREIDPAAEAIGALLATLATVALMVADEQDQFATALASQDVTSQAKEMLMDHYELEAARAVEMLEELSRSSNGPVRDVAQRIVRTF